MYVHDCLSWIEIKHNHMKDKGQDMKWDLSEKIFPLAYHGIFSQVCITLSSNTQFLKDGRYYLKLC